MIAVDTSALMSIVLGEPTAPLCRAALVAADAIAISAETLAEATVVAGRRNRGAAMEELVRSLAPLVIPVTAATATRIGAIYGRWGKGVHPASLNLGDCFAYDVAKQHNCPLLFVGDDFAKTDIASAIASDSLGGP